MADNSESLNLLITESGADQTAAKLNKLDAAANKVVKTTKAQETANKAETKSLLDLERELVKGKKLWEEYGSAKSKANKPSSGGGVDTNKVIGATGRAADAISPAAGGAIRAFEDIKEFGQSLSDVGKLAVGAGVGIGAFTLALTYLQAQAQKVKEAATIELNARAEVIAFIQTATQAEIEARRDELRQKQAIAKAVADDANSVLAQTEAQTNAIGKLNAALGTNQGELSAARENADKANKALGETNTVLSLLDQAASAGFASERDYAKAIEETTKVRTAAAISEAADTYNSELERQRDAMLTSSQIMSKLTSTIQEENAAQAALNELYAAQKRGVTGLDAEITRLQVQIGKAGGDITRLYGLFADRKSIEDAGDALKYTQEQSKETAAAMKAYNAERDALDQKDLESREKLRDALIDIADEAVKAAQDALQTLKDEKATILRDLSRDDQKAERDAALERNKVATESYRAELENFKTYRRRLRDIDLKANDDAFALALNRDFSGLFESGRQQQIAKRDAGLAQRDGVEDIQQARADQLEDLKISLAAERNERIIAAQQRIQDATAAYQAEQVQIQKQRTEAEQKANAQRAKERSALDQQYAYLNQSKANELNLIQSTEQQRVAIIAAAQNALLTQARQFLAAISGGAGGATAAGAASGSGVQFTQTNNINGSNMEAVGSLIESKTRKMIQGYFT